MALYWLSGQDPDEKGFFQVDWTDEMDAAGDTITGTPTFASTAGAAIGVRFSGIAIATGSKKVNVYIDNTDPATNRAALLAASPLTDIVHTITTTGGQTLVRTLSLFIEEDGSDLTVEDGSVVAGADVYGTLAEADLYHARMGNTTWGGTDLERGRMLRRGAAAFDARYLSRFKGSKTASGQSLAWPRINVTDEDGNSVASDAIPLAVRYASFELALAVPAGWAVESANAVERVAAGSVSVTFATPYMQETSLSHVDRMIRPYLKAKGRLVRA